MPHQLLHVETLLGKKVHDPAGKCAGRIEEIRAHREGDSCVVDDFLLGRRALLTRLSIPYLTDSALSLLGSRSPRPTHRVPWRLLDLSDPHRPRLTCPADRLEEFDGRAPSD